MSRPQLDLGDGCEIRVRQVRLVPPVKVGGHGWCCRQYEWSVYQARRVVKQRVYDKHERIAHGTARGATTAFQAAVRWVIAARRAEEAVNEALKHAVPSGKGGHTP